MISSKVREEVAGVTVCNEKLFVVRGVSKVIEQYDVTTFSELAPIIVDELEVIKSLTSCCINKCLYVNDQSAVFRVDLSTKEVISWSVDGGPHGLSVNRTGNVLVACYYDDKIDEYSTRGSLVRSIQLQENHVTRPYHTVQLTDDQYVVCHWGPEEGVSLVNQHGAPIAWYRNSRTTKLVNRPRSSIIVNDCILVADVHNNRILSLNSSLTVASELSLAVDRKLKGPCCMYLDQLRGRLFVGERMGEYRVLVFDKLQLTWIFHQWVYLSFIICLIHLYRVY